MYRCQSIGQQFLAFKKVMQIGDGEGAASIAIAVGIDRSVIALEAGITYIGPAIVSEQGAMSGDTSGESTIEHIDPMGNAFHQILRRGHPH